ncbi:hypothetical protein GCM10010967_54990 [Dyadobacter beijingensis]|uniref:Uncharacterized protein n=1 Tax=Dyadobacter beijingensis TaxID=365489 RepID=A0ABQ2IL68_9BACT|nr:hypothetical protein [Dyadobacter beijingensis]GGN12024.1 hypothetical protein GCM10010967_54990 [Dyadobacter beijingensis]
MKKLIITSVILIGTAGAIFAQSTSSSTDKSKTTKATGQGVQTPSPKNEKQQADAAKDQQQAKSGQTDAPADKPNPTDQVARKSAENDGSNRPGGATHENANYVGSYSDKADDKSMLFSSEAISIRRKNMTEPDTEVKSGSGSSERNTKNHTGTTGNYRNLATQTSRIPSSE